MIPRLLHFIWVGDEAKRPDACIDSWRLMHPEFTVKVWGNRELAERAWINRDLMDNFAQREWAGVADLMRWEILFAEGGIALDADSLCLRPLPEWLFDTEMAACWENELARPGLIATGMLGALPGYPLIDTLIKEIRAQPFVNGTLAWQATGPLRLTQAFHRHAWANLSILPSHFFLPSHYSGITYRGGGPVYAEQFWDSTQVLLGQAGQTSQAERRGEAGESRGIPRVMHVFQLGKPRIEAALETWRKKHPDHIFKLWSDEALQGRAWRTAEHMRSFLGRDDAAVCDLMRWEVLLEEGGIAIDTEGICLQALPEWLHRCEMFAVGESELHRPGLLATSVLGAVPGNALIAQLLAEINAEIILTDRPAWQATGPKRLTDCWQRHRYANLTVLPSHFFLPRHHAGARYAGGGPVFVDHAWHTAPAVAST